MFVKTIIPQPIRRTLILFCLAVALSASVLYDSAYIQTNERFQIPLAGLMALSFAAAFVLQRYSPQLIQPLLLAAWPLHLFTLGFFWACFAIHGGDQLNQFVMYSAFAYATYLVVPVLILLDYNVFTAFVRAIAIMSALLALPSMVGAAGVENVLGIPLTVKFTYAQFSGINASAGVFEHPEGHAFQMAIGILCCLYAWRTTRHLIYVPCLLLTVVGLIISQGRAAIFGLALAFMISWLPAMFRRCRPVFLGTIAVALLFPFFILPLLGQLPGVAGYFRLERGLSGRTEAWQFGLELIEDEPWTGYGFMATTKFTETYKRILRKSGFSGSGTTFHNTFISRAIDLGLVVTGIYLLLYIVPLIRICRTTGFTGEQTLIRGLIILTLTTAIFRDYNIGGIRSTAMIGAIFLGLANLWHFSPLWRESQPSGEATPEPSQSMTAAHAASASRIS